MKVVTADWSIVAAMDCQYGAHVFDGLKFSIYVAGWLGVPRSIRHAFARQDEEGWCGHCLLVFDDVSRVEMSVHTNTKVDGEFAWDPPIESQLSGRGTGIKRFAIDGSLRGFSSSVSMKIFGSSFSIHALENNEPALDFLPGN